MTRRTSTVAAFVTALVTTLALYAQEPAAPAGEAGRTQDPWAPATFNDFRLRAIGPALMSGRVSPIAVHPENKQTWYIGVASGGVWKTTNAGITFTPVFQNEGIYSIGTVVIDPKSPSTVWIGTGESQQPAQRRLGRRRLPQRRRRPHVAECRPEEIRAISGESSSTRATRTSCSSRRTAGSGVPAAIAGSTRPPTAERPGTRSSRSARTPASATSRSIRPIPT